MKAYVLAFLFDDLMENVWLIKKNRPEWQNGKLNGIGGKFEESDGIGDEGWKNAIIRELKEEGDVDLKPDQLMRIGCMYSMNQQNEFILEVFTGKINENLISNTDEEIFKIRVDELKRELLIDNVPAIIELSKLYLTAEVPFKAFELEY